MTDQPTPAADDEDEAAIAADEPVIGADALPDDVRNGDIAEGPGEEDD